MIDQAGAHDPAELLAVHDLAAGYGSMQVLWGVDLGVREGRCTVVLGCNGAGKSTFLRVLLGLLPATSGTLQFGGKDITRLRTDLRVSRGIAFMTETGVFPALSVHENLRLGAYRLGRERTKANLARAYDAFPLLAEHRRRPAGSLSGGQRKLVGVAKVMMGDPKLIVMDEPSSGLSPRAVHDVLTSLRELAGTVSLLIAEQNVAFLELADEVVVLEGGRTRFEGSVEELQADDALHRAFFGLDGH
jgi:branched-chain amino acid transport system ATP-binding protein